MDIQTIRDHLKKFELQPLFIDGLGWNRPSQTTSQIKVSLSTGQSQQQISFSYIAQIQAIPVLKIEQQVSHFDTQSLQRIHRAIKTRHEKHLLLFSDHQSYLKLSYLSQNRTVRPHDFFKGQNADTFIHKLSGIHIGIDETDPTILEISRKLEETFNTEGVTDTFYKDFKAGHLDFQKYISGMPTEQKHWYASVLLNRLMFIWFLQKKMFCNDDAMYLKTKLDESQKEGKDLYYSHFLKLLFFEGFAKKPKDRSDQAKEKLGGIDYLNGGLFVPHPIEEEYGGRIQIKDKAFEKTYEIFQQYEWHVEDEKKGQGQSNEIDPDVLGYIFEKYINDHQKKSMGAFYTRDEITSYLSRQTIDQHILEKINKSPKYNFKSIEELLHKLDANLCRMLLTNEDSILNTLTILDPAVGSGAFLTSAMKKLMDIYSPIIGKIETLGNRDLQNWLDAFEGQHKSIAYGIKKQIILKNLYGVDIMKEATEVCKLRLFLSLVASALDRRELEPLPNIDFNIMHGNSLVGFLKENELRQEQLSFAGPSYKQIKVQFNEMVQRYKTRSFSFEGLKELKKKINDFLDRESSKLNRLLADRCRQEGVKYLELNIDKKVENKRVVESEDIEGLEAFHWNFAFNEIMDQGGFDIIITNPPWDKIELEDKIFCSEYHKNIQKNNTKNSELKRIKKELLKDTKICSKYTNELNKYALQRNYFSEFYQYQIANMTDLEGKTQKSQGRMDTYRLFTERCCGLLKNQGRLGIVLPRGLCGDEGSIKLRKHLLHNSRIDGLITFVNGGKGRKPLFKGVGNPVQFLLLNLKKDRPVNSFPCRFKEKNLHILTKFPKENSRNQVIKKMSSKDYLIPEINNQIDVSIFEKIKKFPFLEEKTKNSWSLQFYTDFNETTHNHYFKNTKKSKNDLPLYKGAAIEQYQFDFNLEKVCRYIDVTSKKVQGSGLAFKNKCYKYHRLVIRAMASTGDIKLISSVIPKNNFITNSLHGVYIQSRLTTFQNKYMLLLQAFLNSFMANYLIKPEIYFNMNIKYLYKLRMPRLTEDHPCFGELVRRSAQLTCTDKVFDDLADEVGIVRGGDTDPHKRWKIQGEIDAIVAHIYGLTQEEFEHILDTFTTGRNQVRLQALKKYALEAFKDKDIACLKKGA